MFRVFIFSIFSLSRLFLLPFALCPAEGRRKGAGVWDAARVILSHIFSGLPHVYISKLHRHLKYKTI